MTTGAEIIKLLNKAIYRGRNCDEDGEVEVIREAMAHMQISDENLIFLVAGFILIGGSAYDQGFEEGFEAGRLEAGL